MSYHRISKTNTNKKKKQQTDTISRDKSSWQIVLPEIISMNQNISKKTTPKIYYQFEESDPYNIAKSYQGSAWHTTKMVSGWIPLHYLYKVPSGNILRHDTIELEESMKKHGFLGGAGQRIIINVYYDGTFKVVEGNHRLASAKKILKPDDLIDIKIEYKGNSHTVDGIWRIKDDWF